jgi:hypothetical protein
MRVNTVSLPHSYTILENSLYDTTLSIIQCVLIYFTVKNYCNVSQNFLLNSEICNTIKYLKLKDFTYVYGVLIVDQ